jgi:hypothetical protein
MVKKSILLICLMLILIETARAESLKFSLGVKSWLAEWETIDQGTAFRSRVGAMYGPVAIVRYQSFFLGATYLMGTFKFPASSVTNTDADRIDTDFTAGYYFNPYFGVTGGYKYIDFTFKFPLVETSPGVFVSTPDLKADAQGPFAGFLGSYPLGRSGFLFYGNATYSWLSRTFKQSGLESTGDFEGISGELGLAYRMPTAPITFTQGFKYQKFEDQAADSSDTFSGIIFSAAYSF